MRESAIEKTICQYARENGWMVYKFTSPAHKGVPDRIFINANGVTTYLEIKMPGEEPTPLQYRELKKLCERGTPAGWVDSLGGGAKFLTKHKDLKICGK
jgi:Holliday junction resolvase